MYIQPSCAADQGLITQNLRKVLRLPKKAKDKPAETQIDLMAMLLQMDGTVEHIIVVKWKLGVYILQFLRSIHSLAIRLRMVIVGVIL